MPARLRTARGAACGPGPGRATERLGLQRPAPAAPRPPSRQPARGPLGLGLLAAVGLAVSPRRALRAARALLLASARHCVPYRRRVAFLAPASPVLAPRVVADLRPGHGQPPPARRRPCSRPGGCQAKCPSRPVAKERSPGGCRCGLASYCRLPLCSNTAGLHCTRMHSVLCRCDIRGSCSDSHLHGNCRQAPTCPRASCVSSRRRAGVAAARCPLPRGPWPRGPVADGPRADGPMGRCPMPGGPWPRRRLFAICRPHAVRRPRYPTPTARCPPAITVPSIIHHPSALLHPPVETARRRPPPLAVRRPAIHRLPSTTHRTMHCRRRRPVVRRRASKCLAAALAWLRASRWRRPPEHAMQP